MYIILLPGMDGTGDLFKPLLENMSSKIKAKIISFPTNEKLSYKKLIEYVRAKLPSNDDFMIVAESFSGPIAFSIAQNPPTNLKSVVFVCSFLKPPRKFLILSKLIPLSFLFRLPIPELFIKRYFLGNKISDDVIHLFRKSISKVSKYVLSFRVREIADLEMTKRIVSIRCVYIQATNDKLVPPSNSKMFEKMISDFEVVKVPGPHFVLQANPGECVKTIEKEYVFQAI